MRLRGLHVIVWTLLLAPLALPLATAGTRDEPEIRDPADLPNRTAADVRLVWFEAEPDGVRFSIQTTDGSLPLQFPDYVYWVYFVIEETGVEVGAVVGFADDGVLRGHLGTGDEGGLNDNAVWRGGFERVANGEVVALRETRGRPSTWSGLIPWGAVDGLEEGATLTELVAGSAHYDRRARQWQGGIDRATSDAVFVAEPPAPVLSRITAGAFPILVPGWALPLIVLACTLAGAGGGYALSRRRPPAAPPAAKSVPVRATAPPAGERFRAAPPRR